ncbi:VirK/YbjX family protein [Avibacterium sp. 21-595]|uniref:VirK/YbjX family protein n=1 Tax=Avibacterium sp. 21-595 TaxID=2911527 RepID=UPI0020263B1F|nr:VirK/YbjX family protein [Avibacterium sp. 21-595]URL06089.1 VirK/YbjX family protein [Avibacterium sp. 21-595]
MSSSFSFPSFAQLYPVEKRVLKRIREKLRYLVRTSLYAKQCQTFTAFLNEKPLWATFFNQNLYRTNALLYAYCDKSFNVQQRLDSISQHFLLAEDKLGEAFCQQLVEQQTLSLSQLTEKLFLKINLNQIDPLEGFFSLNIYDQENQRSVYDASFTFLSPHQILIASIQGPKGENAQDIVRLATKELHGMRPMFMLVNAFKLLAKQLGCDLVGISHKRQAKFRWNDSKRLLFNYDEFWQENAGNLNVQGYWTLPLEIERKPLEDIQSKKRSMYRKRYEMLDKLETDLNTIFS